MAEEHDTEAREHKAFRRVVAASRTLAKQHGLTGDMVDAVSTANHQDLQVRSMRRMEAVATLLEAVVGEDGPAKSASKVKPAAESTSKAEKA